jgi:hypothetical protein
MLSGLSSPYFYRAIERPADAKIGFLGGQAFGALISLLNKVKTVGWLTNFNNLLQGVFSGLL